MKKIILATLMLSLVTYAGSRRIIQRGLPKPAVTVLNGASYWGGTPQYIVKQTLISPTLNGGGFDSLGTGGADVFKYWLENANGGRIADTIIAGNRCIVIQPNGAGDFVAFEQNTILSPGKLYRASYSILSNVSATVGIYIGVYGGAVNVQNIQAGAWARFTSIRNATDARLYFRCTTPNALIIFDNITLEEVEGSADLNGGEMLPNPFCEPNTTGYSSFAGTISYSTSQKYAGSGSLLWVSGGTGARIVCISSIITDNSTGRRTVEFWVRPNRTQPISPRLYDESSANILTGAAVTCSTGVWTKLALNCQLPGTQAGVRVTLVATEAQVGDSVWVDNISLTQSYDAVTCMFGVKSSDYSVTQWWFYAGASASTIPGYGIYSTASNPYCDISDGTTRVTRNMAYRTGPTQNVAYTYNRTGNITPYMDGVAKTPISITNIGRVTVPSTIYVGRHSEGGFYSGRIGQTMLIIYKSGLPADIDSKIAQANAIYKSGRIVPPWVWGPTATVIGNWDWSQGGYDRSGLGNHLSATGNPIILR